MASPAFTGGTRESAEGAILVAMGLALIDANNQHRWWKSQGFKYVTGRGVWLDRHVTTKEALGEKWIAQRLLE